MSPALTIRELDGISDLQQIEAVEKEVWGSSERDLLPLTLIVASKAAGSQWLGAFDGPHLVAFAFALPGIENGRLSLHSHMLAVRPSYRDHDLGFTLKQAQRERALGLGVQQITWTFDPLQSKNAHFNFTKLGVVSNQYRPDFYGPATSSVLHRNGTDRLWVRWPLAARRVQSRLQGKDNRSETLDALSTLVPLIRFDGAGKPVRADLHAALSRQRISIEIPSDIASVEQKDPALALEWRNATRWAFTEALHAGFFVAEFCRTLRGQQGPGAYLLEKGMIEEYVPELARQR
jgi:predicted GNAT superfamily acetyltransferase